VIHGYDGVSQKAEGAGRASHYFSQTRLVTTGTITLQGRQFAVSGLSWMDHEFFTHQLGADQTGWDWFSIQLEDKTELMLFTLRRKDGTIDPYSAGTYVDAAGKASHLRANDFSLTPSGATWKSPQTGATYPLAWNVAVPKLAIVLFATTRLPQQELTAASTFAPRYWEGAMEFSGKRGSTKINGTGYLEMTGYDRPLHWTK
jgi:predicted secreted hydrolase